MSVNILDLVKQAIPADLVSKISTSNNESESHVQNGINALIPTFLLGLSSLPKEKFANIWNIAKSFLGGTSSFSAGNIVGSNVITELLTSVFGDKLSSITNAISNFTHLKPESTQNILSSVAPAALGAIGNHVSAENPSGVWEFFQSQKDNLLAALPAGLSLGSLGLGTFKSPPPEVSHTLASEKSSGGNIGKIIIALIILALLIFFLAKNCNKGKDTVSITDSTTSTHNDTTALLSSLLHESIKVILPNGEEIDAYKGGIEDHLVNFLKSDYKKLGADSLKKIWFDFDNLNFESASDKITDSSQKQINNIAAILKAFPNTKIKIGGYTDKTGDEAANVKLSKGRAVAVKTALYSAGVAAQVTEAEGYGSQYAKFPETASENDRIKDRHVSVSVRE